MTDSESPETPENAAHPDANTVIAAFGGIRPMAAQMGIAVSTVQGWKMRNAIPENRWSDVEAAARTAGIDLAALPRGAKPEEADAAPADDKTAGEAADPDSREADGGDGAGTPQDEPEAKPEETSDTQEPARDLATPDSHPGMDLPPLDERRRGGAVVAWSALLIGVIALVAIVARPIWAPFVQPFMEPLVESYLPKIEQTEPPGTAETAIGEAEINELATRVGGLETKIDNLVRLQEDIVRLDTRVKGLADRPAAAGVGEEALGSLQATLADMDGKLSAMAARLDAAEAGLSDAASGADLAQRIERLDGQLKTLSQDTETVRALATEVRAALAGIEGNVAAVDARLDDIANRPVQSGARAAAVVLAVGQLEASVMAGAPFSGGLDHLARLVGEDAGFAGPMAALRPRAESGLPTRTELNRRFARLAPEATRAAKLEAADGWFDKAMARVSGLVTIRRVDGEPTGPAAPVTKAERALEKDDLTAAVDALKGLDGAVDTWLADATARLEAEAALATLRGLAIDRLSAAEAQLSAEVTQ